MKKRLDLAVRLAALLCFALLVQSCSNTPKFSVEPGSISFGSSVFERRVTLKNNESRSLQWSVETVTRSAADAPWVAAEVPWLECEKTSGTLSPGVENLMITARRNLLQPGSYDYAGLRFFSGATQQIVPVSLVVDAQLKATPSKVYLKPEALSAVFELENQGDEALVWSVRYFEGLDGEERNLPGDMTITPMPSRLAGKSKTSVRVEWTRTRGDFGLRIFSSDAPGHDAVVLFTFSKALSGLSVDPETLRIYYQTGGSSGEQPASRLSFKNTSGSSLSWTLSANGIGGVSADIFQITPARGTLQAGDEAEVLVSVSNPEAAIPGSGNYELYINVDGADGYIVVPLILEVVSLPVIIASDPPEPHSVTPYPNAITLLDFGKDESSKPFFILNGGTLDSRLYFRIKHDDEEVDTPLIVDVSPMKGDTNGPEQIFYLSSVSRMVDGQQIVVTIDRSAMKEDLEYRTLTIEAWDEDGTAVISAVQPWTIQIKAERSPMTIEGAINRSRPPYLMRFVLLLRDMFGQVIPTRTAEELSRLSFEITEDGEVLDLTEAAMQLDGPENLKVNLVLMLDYTGSMYKAGVNDPASPRLPGEVLDEIRESAAMFLDDLPPGYRVAIMFHNDRQPRNRMIHGFSTDRDSLKGALKRFTVPPALHGTSDVYDALIEAIQRLAAEDAEDVLPFDDADLRAIVFISDGKDNSSTQEASAVVSAARDQRVRLYPLTYSAGVSVNYPDMIHLADETGGHLYRAGNADNLTAFLGHRRSLVLKPAPDTGHDPATVAFIVKNAGKDSLSWQASRQSSDDWLSRISPDGGNLAPDEETLVTLTVDPGALKAPFKAGETVLDLLSNDGNGEVSLYLALDDNGLDIQQLSLSLRDEPGRVWEELSNQVVLSYVTPLQRPGNYSIIATWSRPEGGDLRAVFEEDGIFYHGDQHGGQLSLFTTGIHYNEAAPTSETVCRAEAFLRADYVPRNVTHFRLRFFPLFDESIPEEALEAFDQAQMTVEIDQEGLLFFPDESRPNWRLIAKDNGVYNLLTSEAYPLPYASSGNLLRIRFDNLLPFYDACAAAGVAPEFYLDMRVDNSIYYAPSNDGPSGTVYFTYPSGPLNPDRPLRFGEGSDLAAPARSILDLAQPGIYPEVSEVWDRDRDGLPDFDDPYPDDDSRPGRLLSPALLQFTESDLEQSFTVLNNRLDTLTIKVLEIDSSDPALTRDYFTWAFPGEAEVDNLIDYYGELSLKPGERLDCLLYFDADEDLPAGEFTVTLRLKYGLYQEETTEIRVKL